MARYSKGKWIFSEKDVYNLDLTFSPFLAAGLAKFNATIGQGVPCSLLRELYPEILPHEVHTEDQLESALIEYKRRITCMIYAFSINGPDTVECKLVFDNFTLVSGDLEKYKELLALHETKVKEGLQYFSQHYNDLWS